MYESGWFKDLAFRIAVNKSISRAAGFNVEKVQYKNVQFTVWVSHVMWHVNSNA